MNYFGVEKKVAIFNKVSPRDFDRSKMFKLEVPVEVCYYRVVFEFDSGFGKLKDDISNLRRAIQWLEK